MKINNAIYQKTYFFTKKYIVKKFCTGRQLCNFVLIKADTQFSQQKIIEVNEP